MAQLGTCNRYLMAHRTEKKLLFGPLRKGLPRWLSGKESACQCKRWGRCRFSLWARRPSRAGNGNPLQYSCLGNPMDRGAWRFAVQRVAKSQTWLSMHAPSRKSLPTRLTHPQWFSVKVIGQPSKCYKRYSSQVFFGGFAVVTRH